MQLTRPPNAWRLLVLAANGSLTAAGGGSGKTPPSIPPWLAPVWWPSPLAPRLVLQEDGFPFDSVLVSVSVCVDVCVHARVRQRGVFHRVLLPGGFN